MAHDIRRTLDMIHMAACYGTEEHPSSAADSLRLIGDLARRAIMELDSTHVASESRKTGEMDEAFALLRVIRADPWTPHYAVKRIDALLAAMAAQGRT